MGWIKFPGIVKHPHFDELNEIYIGQGDMEGYWLFYVSESKKYVILNKQYFYGVCVVNNQSLLRTELFYGKPYYGVADSNVHYDINYGWVYAKNSYVFQQEYEYYKTVNEMAWGGTDFYHITKINEKLPTTEDTKYDGGGINKNSTTKINFYLKFPGWYSSTLAGEYKWDAQKTTTTETTKFVVGNKSWTQTDKTSVYIQSSDKSVISPEELKDGQYRILNEGGTYYYGFSNNLDQIKNNEFGYWKGTLDADKNIQFVFQKGAKYDVLKDKEEYKGKDVNLTFQYKGFVLENSQYQQSKEDYNIIVGDCAKWM